MVSCPKGRTSASWGTLLVCLLTFLCTSLAVPYSPKVPEDAVEHPRQLTGGDDDDILPFRWFIGWFSECEGPCGGAMTREREVYCMVQCSLWRCEEVQDHNCLNLGLDKPVSVEVCEDAAPDCTTTPAPTTTGTTTPAATTAQTTPQAATTSFGSSADWECVVSSVEVASSTCEDVTGRCYDSCPCCRRKQEGTTLIDDLGSGMDDGPDVMLFIYIGGGAVVGLAALCCLLWLCISSGVKPKEPKKGSSELKSHSSKSSSNSTTQSTKDAKHAWKEAEAFSGFAKSTVGPFDAFEDDFHTTAGSWKAASPSNSATTSSWHPSPVPGSAGTPATSSRAGGSARQHPFAAANTTPRQAPPPPPTEERPSKGDSETDGHPKAADHESSPQSDSRKNAENSPQSDDPIHRRKNAAAAAFAAAERRAEKQARKAAERGTPKGTAAAPRETSEGRPPPDGGVGGTSSQRMGRRLPPEQNLSAVLSVEDRINQVDKELDQSRGKDLDFRRRNFKNLLLRWHPDKNPSQGATEVFRHLMKRRGAYLEA
mmetsp:Transcript_10402/g.18694  ORF Transcript_10402/g.18694 Transcript_10402/m.18694 type:complete len:540 (+) Transcript_10402:87-1706(+)